MPITLKCRDTSGSVAFSAETIDGLPVPARRYMIDNGFITIETNDALARHDIATLLAMPDDLFRLLTPQEQDALVQAQQAQVSVVESVMTAQDGLAAQAALVQPPAKGKKSDANGG